MAAPVWVLSVDLEAKSATFMSGMSDAAKSARTAFADIKSGSGEMTQVVGSSTGSARQAVMLLGDEFGIHLPRGLTTFISSLGPIGPAMEAAFPFIAIALGATLLIEHLVKMHEAGEKLTEDQVRFGTAVQNAFNSMDQKLLQAQIRSDELHHNHLGALAKTLELIDKQSMADLVHQFDTIAKESDVVFAGLKAKWYTLQSGSDGAKASLERFQVAYAALLAKDDAAGASGLLHATLEREQRILALKQQAQATTGGASDAAAGGSGGAKLLQHEAALAELKKLNANWGEQEVASSRELVSVLSDQVAMEAKVSDVKKQDGSNAKDSTASQAAGQTAAAARAAADSVLRINEEKLAAFRASSNAELTIARTSGDEREAVELATADKELQIRLAANNQQLDALNKWSEDYPNQRKALYAKAEELEQQHATTVAEIQSRSDIAQNAQDLQNLEQGIRESLEATDRGSAQRLAAIDAALKAERSRGLQDLGSYRDLLNQRVQTVREASEEEAKLEAEAGKEAAAQESRMGQLMLAAAREHQELIDSGRRMSVQSQIQEETAAANAEYALKLTEMQRQEAALDKGAKDYQNKLKAIQNQETQLTQQHENEVTAIKDKAQKDRNAKILAAENQYEDSIASGLTQVLMGHKSFAAMMQGLANEVVSGLLQAAIKHIEINMMTKQSDAMAAASSAYANGEAMGPAGVILGPVFAAAAYAGVMAFESGGVVPGVGRGDIVPAMLSPGEGILPGSMMDKLNAMANSGGMGGGTHFHAHVRPVYNLQSIDATGLEKLLDKHSDTLNRHVEKTFRKMNS